MCNCARIDGHCMTIYLNHIHRPRGTFHFSRCSMAGRLMWFISHMWLQGDGEREMSPKGAWRVLEHNVVVLHPSTDMKYFNVYFMALTSTTILCNLT